ncbi:MAG: TatD family hydrolase [Colwellia sp.]
MIDIGVNLTNQRFDKDRADVMLRAQQVQVNTILITGTNVDESKNALSLCHEYEAQFPKMLYSTAGVHPHDADNVSTNYIEEISAIASQKQVKAIGECGLDFNRNFSKPEQQIKVFSEQVALAEQLQLPLFLHQRDAFEAWFNVLKPYLGKIPTLITHCFTGTESDLKQCIAADMYIGITGWLCDERRGQALRDIVHLIPKERILIETDAPYLTPRTIRPKPKSSRNEPSYLPYVLKELAQLLSIDEGELAMQTELNSRQAFNLEAL